MRGTETRTRCRLRPSFLKPSFTPHPPLRGTPPRSRCALRRPARGEGSWRRVIEIDGGVHERDDVVLRDHLRQTEIEALGWTVVRFTNDTALGEPWRIDDAIRDRARVLGLL